MTTTLPVADYRPMLGLLRCTACGWERRTTDPERLWADHMRDGCDG